MSLGERIRARRKEMKLTLTELAKRANLSKSFTSELERGKRRCGADTLLRISQVIDIPLDVLMGQGGDQQTNGVTVNLPGSLIRFATDANIPFRHAVCMHWLVRTINDHRQPSKRADPEKWDWTKFYEAVKRFLE